MFAKNHEERLLDRVKFPQDYKSFDIEQLNTLSQELREEVISNVMQTGGHLGAGLGVVELTVALHYVFDTPNDQLIWDVGHQAYPHKILTGRKDKMHSLRQEGGISGFPKRSESEYDVLGVGHSSTSISAGLGIAVARDLKQEANHVVSVIGDGAISAGMAYEAMNNAGHLKNKMIVILNDNEMSIAPAVGAMKNYLCRLMSSQSFVTVREVTKKILKQMPGSVENLVKKAKKYTKDFTTGGNFFEEMGFHYVGPVDGHDLKHLVPILENLRDSDKIESPIFLHVKTEKGKGFEAEKSCGEKYHTIKKTTNSSIPVKDKIVAPSYTSVFSNALIELANDDKNIVAITAAMPTNTGLSEFATHFSDRMFDVGIAEQHAVTFAAGLAINQMKPYVAIYSTFLQRAYDQIVHDVAIQKLPVRFIVDRAGYVGADGATHAGSFDLSFLCNLPNFVVMSPSDEAELAAMVKLSASIDDRPCAIRFPRGNGIGINVPVNYEELQIGKGRIVKKGSKVAVIALGTRLQDVKKAANLLLNEDIEITVVDARFAKPLDKNLINDVVKKHDIILTVEEGAVGGFGSHVQQLLCSEGLLDNNKKFRSLVMPDVFMDHAEPDVMYKKAGLDYKAVYKTIKDLIV